MTKKSVREMLGATVKAAVGVGGKVEHVERKVSGLLKGALLPDAPSDGGPSLPSDTDDSSDPNLPQLEEAVTEARHEINELHEIRGEVMVRGLSKGETGADLEQVTNRLEEAEENLARAVEARTHAHSSETISHPTRNTASGHGGGNPKVSRSRFGRKRLGKL